MFSSTVFISIYVWLGLLVYMRPLAAGAVNEDDFNKENGWENKSNSKDDWKTYPHFHINVNKYVA